MLYGMMETLWVQLSKNGYIRTRRDSSRLSYLGVYRPVAYSDSVECHLVLPVSYSDVAFSPCILFTIQSCFDPDPPPPSADQTSRAVEKQLRN